MDPKSVIDTIIYFIILINSTITILLCLLIFAIVIIFHLKTFTVPLLLSTHTCLALLMSSFMLASMATSSLSGLIDNAVEKYNFTQWCRWRGFFIHGFLCVLYDSYVLQAGYRLFRVVFYRRKSLHTLPLFCFIVLVESLFGLVSISPVLVRGDIIYLPSEHYCQTPFTNIKAILYIALRLFLLPILSIAIIYIYLLNRIGQTQLYCNRYHRRSKRNRRNLIIIRRLLLMLTVLILLGLPSVIFLFILIFTGHLILMTYRIGWLSVSFSLVFLAYMLIQLTRPLRKTMRKLFCREKHHVNKP